MIEEGREGGRERQMERCGDCDMRGVAQVASHTPQSNRGKKEKCTSKLQSRSLENDTEGSQAFDSLVR